ncbi:MAG: TIGR00296 family protein [Thermoplasmata archaeon]
MSDPEGEEAVRWARSALASALGAERATVRATPPSGRLSPAFHERRGAFVTLKRHPSGDLRGCIGFPLPVLPLGEAVAQAAVAAGVDDPRFPPVTAPELGRLTVEVSVLGLPQPIPVGNPAETVAAVRVGRDGLIVDGQGRSGLLLPQVAPEQGWNEEELLAGTCEKAGLPPDAWRAPGVRIRRFEAEVFVEVAPGGRVEREPTEITDAPERPSR